MQVEALFGLSAFFSTLTSYRAEGCGYYKKASPIQMRGQVVLARFGRTGSICGTELKAARAALKPRIAIILANLWAFDGGQPAKT